MFGSDEEMCTSETKKKTVEIKSTRSCYVKDQICRGDTSGLLNACRDSQSQCIDFKIVICFKEHGTILAALYPLSKKLACVLKPIENLSHDI